jgi:hypothetical protein
MLTTAVILFLVGAVFGLLVWLKVMGGKPTSKPVALVHGLIVVIAFLLVVVYSVSATGPIPLASIILFAVAAVGGLTLFIRDLSKTPGPKWLAVVHPVIAVIALILLVVFIAGNS